jgi:hypothetical protein
MVSTDRRAQLAAEAAQLARQLGYVTRGKNPVAYENIGCWFHLFLEPHHTRLDIQRARRWLRRHHRVLGITETRVAKAGG